MKIKTLKKFKKINYFINCFALGNIIGMIILPPVAPLFLITDVSILTICLIINVVIDCYKDELAKVDS
jgi:hypothetical protein